MTVMLKEKSELVHFMIEETWGPYLCAYVGGERSRKAVSCFAIEIPNGVNPMNPVGWCRLC